MCGLRFDDFYANRELFSPTYLREVQTRAKRLNPKLIFLPLMYFNEITRRFVEDYHDVIDGVVVAYPQDREEIEYARAILKGETLTTPSQLGCPWNAPTTAGDFVSAELSARAGASRFTIPFIVMTAGNAGEFRQRHGDPASPERIAQWLDMSLQAKADGFCDGVVIYCLDKQPQSTTFALAQKAFRELKNKKR